MKSKFFLSFMEYIEIKDNKIMKFFYILFYFLVLFFISYLYIYALDVSKQDKIDYDSLNKSYLEFRKFIIDNLKVKEYNYSDYSIHWVFGFSTGHFSNDPLAAEASRYIVSKFFYDEIKIGDKISVFAWEMDLWDHLGYKPNTLEVISKDYDFIKKLSSLFPYSPKKDTIGGHDTEKAIIEIIDKLNYPQDVVIILITPTAFSIAAKDTKVIGQNNPQYLQILQKYDRIITNPKDLSSFNINYAIIKYNQQKINRKLDIVLLLPKVFVSYKIIENQQIIKKLYTTEYLYTNKNLYITENLYTNKNLYNTNKNLYTTQNLYTTENLYTTRNLYTTQNLYTTKTNDTPNANQIPINPTDISKNNQNFMLCCSCISIFIFIIGIVAYILSKSKQFYIYFYQTENDNEERYYTELKRNKVILITTENKQSSDKEEYFIINKNYLIRGTELPKGDLAKIIYDNKGIFIEPNDCRLFVLDQEYEKYQVNSSDELIEVFLQDNERKSWKIRFFIKIVYKK